MSNQVYSKPGQLYKDILKAKYILDQNGTVFEIKGVAVNGNVLQVDGTDLKFQNVSGPISVNPVYIDTTTISSDGSHNLIVDNSTGNFQFKGTQDDFLKMVRGSEEVVHRLYSNGYYYIISPSRIVLSTGNPTATPGAQEPFQFNGGANSIVRTYGGNLTVETLLDGTIGGNLNLKTCYGHYTNFEDTDDVTAKTGTGKYRCAGGMAIAKTLWADKLNADTDIKAYGDLHVKYGTAPIHHSYKSDAVAITWTGPWASDQNSTFYARRVQNVVHLVLVGIQSAGSVATYIRNTAGTYLPAEYRPIVDIEEYVRIINNVALSGVFMRIYTTGEIRIYATDAEGNFGIVGNVGFYSTSPDYCC
jgi:hypothetical protein